ncbi:hypothetical protein Nepgr_024048 [Nepenthes gracilis]|uniref:Btz domain-containing protein n=1 Tax=Nepenthes gracilis TaxID=150966 RepID=A0AAD3T2G3_NEPGR|nr:hypothetical protein Nepgr_024048 [Nepenthes gracilis]
MADEETEYESDPEEAKLSLQTRRKEASDDEEEEEGEGKGTGRERRDKPPTRGGIDSDGESDGQGGAAVYGDEELEVEEEEEEYYEEEEVTEEYDEIDGEYGAENEGADGGEEGEGSPQAVARDQEMEMERGTAVVSEGHGLTDNAGVRNRRTFGGRKLWESKDDRKWGHDKFEEMNMQERQYEEGRKYSRGQYRGRGKARNTDRGFAKGSRLRAYDDNHNPRAYYGNDAPKAVRGRGPRRYQPLKSKIEASPTQHKQLVKSLSKTSQTTSGRMTMLTTIIQPEPVAAKNVASNLSSASPPFYPSGSSNKENNLTQKRDVQTGGGNRNIRSAVMEDGYTMQQPNLFPRGKNVIDSVGVDKLYVNDSVPAVPSKQLSNLRIPAASSSMIANQAPLSRVQSRGLPLLRPNSFQLSPTNYQVNKVSPPAQVHTQRNPVQSKIQYSLQPAAQQLRPVNPPQVSMPKSSLSLSVLEPGESQSTPESNKSKTALVGKGKAMAPGSGRAPLLYSGAQVMESGGNIVMGHGDHNFPATPAFLPVMQFGGQHPGGVGVPAVGMAFPGYVAQPQLGLGNSEMTWLPVLAGAAGAIGATYCSPYLAVDGAYDTRSTGQTSALPASGEDNNGNKMSDKLKPQQRPELSCVELSQRQNKPRRYSEMNFGQ